MQRFFTNPSSILKRWLFLWLAVFAFQSVHGQTYCAARGTYPWEQWISGVSISNTAFYNPSDKDGYGNFTSTVVSLEQGRPNYSLALTASFSWIGDPRNANLFWTAWIDYNADGDFTDAGETIVSIPATPTTNTVLFSVPNTVPLGRKRLRIALKEGSNATSCETFARGEVEDYSVDIVSGITAAGRDQLRIINIASPNVADQSGTTTQNITFRNTGSVASSAARRVAVYETSQYQGEPWAFRFSGIARTSNFVAIGRSIAPNETVTIPITFQLSDSFSLKSPLATIAQIGKSAIVGFENTPVYPLGSSVAQVSSSIVDTLYNFSPIQTVNLPDGNLSCEIIATDTTYGGDNTIRYTVRARNLGTQPVRQVQVSLYALLGYNEFNASSIPSVGTIERANPYPYGPAIEIGNWNVGTMAAGATATCQVTITSNRFAYEPEVRIGTGILSTQLDNTNPNFVDNQDFTFSRTKPRAALSIPNLTIVPSPTIRLNDSVTVNVTVRNSGNLAANNVFVALSLLPNQTDSVGGYNLQSNVGGINNISIPANTTLTISRRILVDAFIPVATYYLRAKVDANNSVGELNEYDNSFVTGALNFVSNTGGGRDSLRILSATPVRSTVAPNDTLSISFLITNRGTAASSASRLVNLYDLQANFGRIGGTLNYQKISNEVPIGISIQPGDTQRVIVRVRMDTGYTHKKTYIAGRIPPFFFEQGVHFGMSGYGNVNFLLLLDTFPVRLATQITAILPATDLSVQMNSNTLNYVGNELVYSVTVRNNGTIPAPQTEVKVFDLSFNYTNAVLTPSKGATTLGNIVSTVNAVYGVWFVGTLAPGESATCQVRLSTTQYDIPNSVWDIDATAQSLKTLDPVANNNAALLRFIRTGNPTNTCATNLLQNGGFESGLTNWEGNGVSTTTANTGTRAARICNSGDVIYQQLSTVAGNQYQINSLSVKVDANTNGTVGIKFLNNSFIPIRDNALIGITPSQSNYTQLFTIPYGFTAPAGAAYVQIYVTKSNGAGCIYVDDVCLTANNCTTDNVPPVFSGCPGSEGRGTTGCETFTWIPPTATDNCSTPTITVRTKSGNALSANSTPTLAIFQVCGSLGIDSVFYTATDARGNQSVCSFELRATNTCTTSNYIGSLPRNLILRTTGTCASHKWEVPATFSPCGRPCQYAPRTFLSATPTVNVVRTTPVCSQITLDSACFPIGRTILTYAGDTFHVFVIQTTTGTTDIGLSIGATPPVYRQYASNTIRVTAQNLGNQPVTNVKVTLPFPTKTVNGGAATASTGAWNEWCAGGAQCFEWTIPTLAANATATLDVPLYVLDATAPIVVTARLLAATPTDVNAANNVATVTLNRSTATSALVTNRVVLAANVLDQDKAQLSWVSIEPTRTTHYEIQTLNENGVFETQNAVVAKYLDDAMHDYSYVETQSLPENSQKKVVTYRIKAIILGGGEILSTPKTLAFTALSNAEVFPNPASDNVFVALKKYENQSVVLSVYDNLGRLVAKNAIEAASSAPVLLDTKDWLDGTYLLKIEAKNYRTILRRFVVTH